MHACMHAHSGTFIVALDSPFVRRLDLFFGSVESCCIPLNVDILLTCWKGNGPLCLPHSPPAGVCLSPLPGGSMQAATGQSDITFTYNDK